MDIYVAELDEKSRVAAVWVRPDKARSPVVLSPGTDAFAPRSSDEFSGAPREEIVQWLTSPQGNTRHPA